MVTVRRLRARLSRGPDQLDLFSKRRRHDEARLLARLREAEEPHGPHGLTRRETKALMRPLPRITAFDR